MSSLSTLQQGLLNIRHQVPFLQAHQDGSIIIQRRLLSPLYDDTARLHFGDKHQQVRSESAELEHRPPLLRHLQDRARRHGPLTKQRTRRQPHPTCERGQQARTLSSGPVCHGKISCLPPLVPWAALIHSIGSCSRPSLLLPCSRTRRTDVAMFVIRSSTM